MRPLMSDDYPQQRRFARQLSPTRRDHMLAEIDALALELDELAAATASGSVSFAARADYLRARDAHHRATVAWMAATSAEDLMPASDALRRCRVALEASRAVMRG
jgi:hypothetical protein